MKNVGSLSRGTLIASVIRFGCWLSDWRLESGKVKMAGSLEVGRLGDKEARRVEGYGTMKREAQMELYWCS